MKLNPEQVAAIKDRLCKNRPQREVADEFGCSRSIVSDIATGRVHTDIPWPGDPPVKRAGGQHKPLPDQNDERIRALESEVIHLRSERDHARREAKSSAKQHGLFLAVADEMSKVVTPFDALPKQPILVNTGGSHLNKTIEEHIVMHLSDGHHDQIVTPAECGGMEEHNFSVSCRRAETYVDTVVDWTQRTLAPRFKFKVLTVLAYGDHTSGEIHGSVDRSQFRNQFKNCFAIGQLHALMYRDLAPYFDQINVVYVPGNHGRRSVKKNYHGAHDNWDYLIARVAELHCQDFRNVSFLVPNAFSANIVINGVGFNVSHGDDVKSSLGIPFYGMVRRQKGLMALGAMKEGVRVRYFCMGHHHVAASLQDLDGELLVNGPWVGTDAFAYNAFSGYREPSQWLHGVNPKRGITWRLNVQLRSEDELEGPRRYRIIEN